MSRTIVELILREKHAHECITLDGNRLVNRADSPGRVRNRFTYYGRNRDGVSVAKRYQDLDDALVVSRMEKSRKAGNAILLAGATVTDPANSWFDATPLPLWIGKNYLDVMRTVNQWDSTFCWMFATLMAILYSRPEYIPTVICKGPDNNLSVYFRNLLLANPVVMMITPMLHKDRALLTGQCSGPALITKAYVIANYGGDYSRIPLGFPGNAMNFLGVRNQTVFSGYPGVAAMVATALNNRLPVVLTTPPTMPAGVDLIGSHCYAVIGIDLQARTLTLVQPWPYDGQAVNDNDPNDKIVTVNLDRLMTPASGNGYFHFSIGQSFAVDVMPCDPNLDGIVDVQDLGLIANSWQQLGQRLMVDLNQDGGNDVQDLGMVSNKWQATLYPNQASGTYSLQKVA